MLQLTNLVALFAITAPAEIMGCYLPWLVLKQGKPTWLLLAAVALLSRPTKVFDKTCFNQ
jgi:small multidrug resistance family-3 protein